MKIPTFNGNDGTLDLGRFGRAPVVLYPSFFIAALFVTSYFWKVNNGNAPLLVAGGALILFLSILLHELAHAEVGRRYGVIAYRIEVNVLGGLVHFMNQPRRMRDDLAITIAGPLSNAALTLVALIVLALVPDAVPDPTFAGNPYIVRPPMGAIERLARFSLYLNAGLAIVNMLPAFPLDGGRLAYMVIAEKYDRRAATLVVGLLGTILAVIAKLVFLGTLLAGIPIWSPPPFLPNWDALKLAWKGQAIRI